MIAEYHVPSLWRVRLVKHFLVPEKSDTILDAGCGDGHLSTALSENAKKVIGVDLSKKIIEELHKRNKIDSVEFIVSDLHNLRLKQESFDKVVCIDVLEHVDNVEKVIDNISHVLKNGGTFLSIIPLEERKGHGHLKYGIKDLEKIFIKNRFSPEFHLLSPPFFTRTLTRIVLFLQSKTVYKSHEVDSFEDTTAFHLYKKKPASFIIYTKLFFILRLIMKLDRKVYVNGNDILLIVAKKCL